MSTSKVVMVFVGGDSWLDKEIETVSEGDVSHAAGILFDSTYEAIGLKEETDKYPGVWLHRLNKYNGNPYAKFIEVEIPDIEGLKDEARKLLGTLYGYMNCGRTAVYDLTGIQIPDNSLTVMCSETWTRLLRGGKVNVLPD